MPLFSLLPPSLCPTSLQPNRRSSSSCFALSVSQSLKASNRRSSGSGSNGSAAILWFKQDLRVDDHPGLLQASRFPALVPLYVFDHRILSRYDDEKLELVIFALEDLRKLLKEKGSNLMIRFGNAENVIKDLVEEVKASNVFAEVEVEYHLLEIMDVVEESLVRMPLFDRRQEIVLWQTPFYDIKNLKDLPASYVDFEKLQLPVTSPILPSKLPGAEMAVDWGSLPTLDIVKKFMNENPFKLTESWTLIKGMRTESILQKKLSKSGKISPNKLNFKHTKTKRVDKYVFVTQNQKVVGGGTNSVLNALAAYLRYLEGTARDDWQEVHEKLRKNEIRDGASFLALFGPALCLGIVSRRRVHYEAIKYEKERNAGFLSPFGYSTATVAAAADTVRSMEYTVVGHEGPAILLIHGFGAFFEHYRDNIQSISKDGSRVWAITILGFGKSEKPNVVYTELMWAELVRDFIIEVVGEPVHLVGNSIGGYFVALVACFWPVLVKSIVLINSAGDIIPGYTNMQSSKERPTSGAAWLGARLLLFYLRLNTESIVKNCYPTKAERVDDWLITEMKRASYDPGVLVVLESIFSLDLSLPLNFLLEGFKEQVLIIQGMKDPISNSKSKVTMLKEHCPGVVIRELDAGHCPHDEQPEEVNSIISEWMDRVASKLVSAACS